MASRGIDLGGDLSDLKRFDVCAERGFLPEQDPLQRLPELYAPWEELAADLPRLIPTGRLRWLLRTLPELPVHDLKTEPELRRAMLLLSYLGHAYVWCEEEPAGAIPAPLAIPWCDVAGRLGRPPVLSYASYALDNWRRFDRGASLELGNFALLQNFLGGVDEDWFVAIHIDIEAKAAPLLRRVGPLLEALAADDEAGVTTALAEVAACVETLAHVLERMHEYCDPYVYYRRVRPWIHGWCDHPALPEGVVYEGVERFDGRPQRFRGETGAQSGIVPALDALLGIHHGDDPLRAYLGQLRDYMPPRHRAFVEAIESGPSLRAFVQTRARSSTELGHAYNECVLWLEAFRATHLDYAGRYIHRQAEHGRSNPTRTGTAGTPFMRYLKKHREETDQHRLR